MGEAESKRAEFDKSVLLNPRPTRMRSDSVDTPVTLSRSDFGPQLNASNIPREFSLSMVAKEVKINSITLSQHDVSLKLEPADGKWLDREFT